MQHGNGKVKPKSNKTRRVAMISLRVISSRGEFN